jgi:hypothetical protein
MSETTSKAAIRERHKQTRNADTAKGLYTKVRSKIVKDPKTGYGIVVTKARELMIEKLGHNIPSNMVAHHLAGGSSVDDTWSQEKNAALVPKGENTAESNYRRGGKSRAWIKKKIGVV